MLHDMNQHRRCPQLWLGVPRHLFFDVTVSVAVLKCAEVTDPKAVCEEASIFL